MLCGECYAGMALYRAEPDEAIQQQVAASLRTLAGYMVKAKDGALAYFRMSAADPTPAENAKYFSLHLPLAFSEALRLWPDHGDAALWRDCCAAALKKYQAQAAANAYGLTTDFCSTADGWKTMDWGYYAPSFNMDLSYTALFLSEIAPLFGRENCLPLAQRLLDFVIGANPADISSVEGVGYNQPQRAVFGEFFPAQPQIPGGVFTDFRPVEPDYSGFGLEYDMPIVGGYLYALSYYGRAVAEP